MKLSVNILTWDCLPTLHDILHILSGELKDIDSEVIVIDNGSTDGCKEMATKAFDTNQGISIGKNAGIDMSKGEYILLLDGDVLPVPNSIKLLLEWLENHPEEYAIGVYPNKFTNQRGQEEKYCRELFEPIVYTATCLYYGLYRKTLFDLGVRCSIDGPFGLPGYGWEDRDFYFQMKEKGIKQWVAHINHPAGKYFHAINSSIRVMGIDEYIRTSRERAKYFKEKWTSSLIAT